MPTRRGPAARLERITVKPESKRYTTTVGTGTVVFETGKLAAQAGGAVTVALNDALIFAAATMGNVREGIDFFPLSVEYEERLYAGGKIPGSFFRREGRPGAEAILTARLTDRPLRPLFQKGMRNEVQVMMFSLSAAADAALIGCKILESLDHPIILSGREG